MTAFRRARSPSLFLADPFAYLNDALAVEEQRVCVRGNEYCLRAMRDGDAALLFDYQLRNLQRLRAVNPGMTQPRTLEQVQEQVASAIEQTQKHERFVVLILQGEKLVSEIDFHHFSPLPLSGCWVGYSVDQECEGFGILRTALPIAISSLFQRSSLHRIQASHDVENLRSGKVLMRVGFEREALLKQYLLVDGHWQDHILYSLIRPSRLSGLESAD